MINTKDATVKKRGGRSRFLFPIEKGKKTQLLFQLLLVCSLIILLLYIELKDVISQ